MRTKKKEQLTEQPTDFVILRLSTPAELERVARERARNYGRAMEPPTIYFNPWSGEWCESVRQAGKAVHQSHFIVEAATQEQFEAAKTNSVDADTIEKWKNDAQGVRPRLASVHFAGYSG